jgi:hypothetical protein
MPILKSPRVASAYNQLTFSLQGSGLEESGHNRSLDSGATPTGYSVPPALAPFFLPLARGEFKSAFRRNFFRDVAPKLMHMGRQIRSQKNASDRQD